jgi:hypothetical protein
MAQCQVLSAKSCLHRINLRGQNEITLRQSTDDMSPDGDLGFSPGQQNVGMMSLLLGQRTHAVHKIQRGLEIGKLESTRDVMLVDNLPIGQLMAEFMQRRAVKRRHPAPARHTILVRKRSHNEGSLAQVEILKTCLPERSGAAAKRPFQAVEGPHITRSIHRA